MKIGTGDWNTTDDAPKDGRRIIAIGKIIYHEDCYVSSENFVAEIFWQKNQSGYEGWHDSRGLTIARTLEDEVIIHWWLPSQIAREEVA